MCSGGGCSANICRGVTWEKPNLQSKEAHMYACFRGCRIGRKAVQLNIIKYKYNYVISPVIVGMCDKCYACSLQCSFCNEFVNVVESRDVHDSILRHLIKHIGFGRKQLYNGVINGEKRSEIISDITEIIPQLLFLLPGTPYDTKKAIIPSRPEKEPYDFVKLAHNSSYSCLWCNKEFDCLPDKILFEAHAKTHM